MFLTRDYSSFNLLVAILLILIFALANLGIEIFRPANKYGVITQIEIKPGFSGRQIAQLLAQKKLISQKNLFLLLVYFTRLSGQLKAGRYEIHSSYNMLEILDKLAKGDCIKVKVTIPEGYNLEQIASLLERKKLVLKEEFLSACQNPEVIKKIKKTKLPLDSLEGYLFPDTYLVDTSFSVETIIKMMTKRQEEVLRRILRRFPLKDALSLHQILTLASLIEKEAKIKEEKYLISSVFHNRLRIGMKLDSCASVRYGLKKFKGKLTYTDLETDSPYNTYRRAGLPPGPICNPGREAIEAAFSPSSTNYLYFVLKPDGSHFFSSNLATHLWAKRKYQEEQND
jgi:UPF0755 protein